MIDRKDVDVIIKLIEELELKNYNPMKIYGVNYTEIKEYSIWKVPNDINLYYIKYKMEFGTDFINNKVTETENLEMYFRFQQINDKRTIKEVKTRNIDMDYVGYFVENEDPIFKKEEIGDMSIYKKGFEILIDYFEYIPIEDQDKIHAKLLRLGL